MSRSIITLRERSTCCSVMTLIPSIKADGAKATIKLGKELAPLSWQITLMSKTATSFSKLTVSFRYHKYPPVATAVLTVAVLTYLWAADLAEVECLNALTGIMNAWHTKRDVIVLDQLV